MRHDRIKSFRTQGYDQTQAIMICDQNLQGQSPSHKVKHSIINNKYEHLYLYTYTHTHISKCEQ